MNRETIFSPDRLYRYTLWREWSDDLFANRTKEGFVQFIGLNPSTADENKDDPTIRRCRDFAKRWGFLSMCMTNLFAFRATLPSDMKNHTAPTGWMNDDWILKIAKEASLTICAWGKDGSHMQRDKEVIEFLKTDKIKLFHLGLNGDGTPKHPLYLKKTTEPIIMA